MILFRIKKPQVAWKPDDRVAALIDADKAAFIYESADKFLGETIDLASEYKRVSMQFLGILIASLTAVVGFLLLKCDVISHVCGEHPHLYWPAFVMGCGYFIAALTIGIGCLSMYTYHFRGNEPANLISMDVCERSLPIIQASEAIAIQAAIKANITANYWIALFFKLSLFVAIMSPVIAFGMVAL